MGNMDDSLWWHMLKQKPEVSYDVVSPEWPAQQQEPAPVPTPPTKVIPIEMGMYFVAGVHGKQWQLLTPGITKEEAIKRAKGRASGQPKTEVLILKLVASTKSTVTVEEPVFVE
jgi:hypothetical protein